MAEPTAWALPGPSKIFQFSGWMSCQYFPMRWMQHCGYGDHVLGSQTDNRLKGLKRPKLLKGWENIWLERGASTSDLLPKVIWSLTFESEETLNFTKFRWDAMSRRSFLPKSLDDFANPKKIIQYFTHHMTIILAKSNALHGSQAALYHTPIKPCERWPK